MPRKASASRTKAFSLMHYIDNTFGMKSHFLRAVAVLWFTSSLGVVLSTAVGWKTASVKRVVAYVCLTGLATLLSAFTATCFRFGDCPRAAYFSASMGIFAISAAALNFG